MSWSRADLDKFKEGPEFFGLLKRLFDAKGYQNVRITHGADEFGRDLIADEVILDALYHTAIVVKSQKVTGNASGKGSASEIYYQVRQSFGKESTVLPMLEAKRVSRVIVITSKSFSGPALVSLRASCESEWSGMVAFWDGDRLWKELQSHLGPAAIIGSIKSLLDDSAKFDEHYRLVTPGTGGPGVGSIGLVQSDGVCLEIVEKYPGASKVSPFKVSFSAKGKAAAPFQQMLTGAGGQMLFKEGEGKAAYPPILQSMMEGGELRELRVVPHGPKARSENLLNFTVVTAAGDEAQYGPVELRIDPAANNLLSNAHQSAALQVRVRTSVKTTDDSGEIGFALDVPEAGVPFREFIRAFKFYKNLPEAIVVVLHNKSTSEVGTLRFPNGTFESPPPHLSQLAEDLELCQSRSPVDLLLPGSDDQTAVLREVRSAAQHLRCQSRTTYQLTMDLASLEEMAKTPAESPIAINFNLLLPCGGQLLGPFAFTLKCVRATVSAEASDETGMGVLHLSASEGCKIEFEVN